VIVIAIVKKVYIIHMKAIVQNEYSGSGDIYQ
jgi:hypothetical protein